MKYSFKQELVRHMKNFTYFSLIVTLMLALIGCTLRQGGVVSTEAISDEQLARDVLLNFLESLHNGDYDEAIKLYDGTYETMIDHNPSIDPNDHAALLRNACTLNGMQCLRVKIVGLEEKVRGEQYVFKVEFLMEDGTLFQLGPCCGDDATSFPPQSVFHFTVMKVDQNGFAVMGLPPYAP